jgi:hypothetical protein
MAIFTADLRRRNVDFDVASDPLASAAWLLVLQQSYADPILARGK